MTYDDIVAIFFTPRDDLPPQPVTTDDAARRLRDAVEPIATQGWWAREPNERLEALGLGFFDGYVWGRAASLGEVAAPVVVAAFGAFEPGMLTAVYEHGRAVARRDDVLAARADGAIASLAAVVDNAEADALAGPLLGVLAELDGMGRPLFSALRALPVPDAPVGRLWRAAELVREHRGDGHVAACVASGLDVVALNVLTELWLGYPVGEYTQTRGFGSDRITEAVALLEARGFVGAGTLTEAGRHARLALEHATDASQAALVAALGSGLDDLVARADAVSSRLVAAGAFPPDPRKRAAG